LIGSGGQACATWKQDRKSLYIRGSTGHHIESVTIRPLHDNEEIKAIRCLSNLVRS
jgi:hypothetical protein